MAAPTKPADEKRSKTLPVRMTVDLHTRLRAQAKATDVSISERAVACLTAQLAEWEKSQQSR